MKYILIDLVINFKMLNYFKVWNYLKVFLRFSALQKGFKENSLNLFRIFNALSCCTKRYIYKFLFSFIMYCVICAVFQQIASVSQEFQVINMGYIMKHTS